MKKKVLSCLSTSSVSQSLAACVPGLSDGAGPYLGRNSDSTPLSEEQTTEVHVRDTLPRYLGIIEKVVVKSGGVLGVSGKNRADGCAMKGTADVDIHWMITTTPAIDYEDLRRVVVEEAQRNGFGYPWDPVHRDKLNFRTATVGDEYGNKPSFYHHEAKGGIVINLYSECMFLSQPLSPDTPRWLYPLPSLGEMFSNLTIMQAFDDNGDENSELHPQSGTQSGG